MNSDLWAACGTNEVQMSAGRCGEAVGQRLAFGGRCHGRLADDPVAGVTGHAQREEMRPVGG